MDEWRRPIMAKDPAMSGPVSKLEGGTYESSEEARENLTRSEIINKFGEAFGRALLDAGYSSFTSLRLASDEELLAIGGVGPAKLAQIREVVGAEAVPEEEEELPELAELPAGEPEGIEMGAPMAFGPDSTPVDTAPRFGEEDAVSPRIARIREQAALQEAEAARVREIAVATEAAAEPEPAPVEEVIDEVVDAEIEEDPAGQAEETLEEIAAELPISGEEAREIAEGALEEAIAMEQSGEVDEPPAEVPASETVDEGPPVPKDE
jgi:hypothetical protein